MKLMNSPGLIVKELRLSVFSPSVTLSIKLSVNSLEVHLWPINVFIGVS